MEVLRRVEHLQERRGGVATPVRAHLVDLVQHQHEVPRLRAPDRLDDPSGHGSDVGAAVSPDLRLIVNPPEGDPDKLPPECPGNRLPEAGLPNPWWPHEAQDQLGAGAAR